jgi:hypothetical protein
VIWKKNSKNRNATVNPSMSISKTDTKQRVRLSKISITKLNKVAKIIREALCSEGWEGVRPVCLDLLHP